MKVPVSFLSLFAVFGLLCSFTSAARNKKSKSVTTLLDAKWEVTPLVLEVGEYLSDENIDLYWSFIDEISNLNPPLYEIGNEKQQYEKVIEIVSKLLTNSQEMLLKFGLSLHIYSPKVEMFNQIAKEQDLPLCPVVVDVAGQYLCDLEEIENKIENLDVANFKNADLYRVDHHYPGSENKSIVAVLYGELGRKEFLPFHKKLKALALDGKIDYVLRHYIQKRSAKKLRLSGYGVELQMKSTEYKVQDDTQLHDSDDSQEGEDEEETEVEGFNFATLKKLFPDVKKDLDKFKQHLEESSSEMAPLKVWQFQELSLQAAERIMSSPKEEVLKIFTHIAQNFPILAKSLVKTVVKPELKAEILKNQDMFSSILNLQPSDTALFINGMFFDLDLVDIYTLLEIMRQELRTMEGLFKIGFRNKTFTSLLSLDFNGGTSGSSQEFAMDVRDSAVNWINDIEKDSRYRRWPTSLMELLKPTFPGMLRQVRRNLFSLVLMIDPTSTGIKDVLSLVESLVLQAAPIRVGVVFSVNPNPSVTGLDDAGVALMCAYNYISQEKSPIDAFSFLLSVIRSTSDLSVTVEYVKKLLSQKFSVDVNDILGEDSDYDFGRHLSHDFYQRSGFTSLPQAMLNGVPLPPSQINIDEFEDAVLQEIMVQTPTIQKAVFRGKLLDSDDVFDYLMNQPNVMPRLNQRVLSKDGNNYLDMTGTAKTTMDVQELLQMSKAEMTATAIENLKYFSLPRKGNGYFTMTYWVVGDLDCKKTRELLSTALANMKSNTASRVTFLPNVNGDKTNNVNKLVLAALDALPPERATNYVIELLKSDKLDTYRDNPDALEVPIDVFSRLDTQELSLKMLRVYCQRVLNFQAGQRGVIANGRVIGPLEENEMFTIEDFALLERFSSSVYLENVEKTLAGSEEEGEISSNNFLRMVSMLISRPQTKSRFDVAYSGEEHSVLHLPATHSDRPAFEIIAIVDPVSRGAQKLGAILQVLQEVLNCNIKLFLNSAEKNSDMPLKSFYRFVLEPEIQFTEDGLQHSGPVARFSNMPTAPLLTQNIHVPDNWLVEVVRAVYDLDNIRLENVDSVVHSEYELEYLLLEGHCFDAATGSPPRGLQITLGTGKKAVMVDTIVMANLGYFQLKANPGAWLLRLRQGRSADIYDIVGHEGSDTPKNSSDIKVLISTLRSNVIKLKVQKKPDKINMDLLADDGEENTGIWNSITSSFTGSDEEVEEKLNIFSVASGHLYERFLRIMMLSVIKHTKRPVKFWFLKNYLSPQLKDFLPYMAKEYGFEYELVQYKWPRWLHQQTEKQRTIWGYKILFLDVLFPLDVKKIIFVDADQVVRADLKELQQLDLGGAPYGYTPFCESRREMDGFRFWKQGYWRNHLQGRKYHISALYVVDLKRFRRIAAGDRLRGQYQALSQDPNSLSNLDQDLPNNMIHQVAIKSLPQEWLWCETWCDDNSKERAKTIDLCNNPMTKEAKLTAAMRILPEWKDYDEEIRQLQKKIDSGVLDSDPSENGETENNSDIHSEL